MSRTFAIKNITQKELKESLSRFNVTLIGGGLDEAPQAYKDIETVMLSQKQLVEVVGKFYPRIVRMDRRSPLTLETIAACLADVEQPEARVGERVRVADLDECAQAFGVP
jgi:hypothetical protein